MARESRPLRRRTRRIAALVGGVLLAGAATWVVTLPMRQTRFQVVEHRLERAGEGAEVRGRLKNHGEGAGEVLVEAYLYDSHNRWLGTAQSSIAGAPADSIVPFTIPVASGFARAVERYSLYAGLEPNPYAPGM